MMSTGRTKLIKTPLNRELPRVREFYIGREKAVANSRIVPVLVKPDDIVNSGNYP